MKANEKLKSFCIPCKKETNQVVLCVHSESYDGEAGSPDEGFWWRGNYAVIQCLGCDAISFRETSYTSEDFDYGAQGWEPGIRLFPQPDENSLPIKSFVNVPTKIREIYAETINCFNFKAPILCTAGIRSIIESVCLTKGIKDGPEIGANGKSTGKRKQDLKARIEGMFESGLVTANHKEILHEYRSLGNEAIHQMIPLSPDEARTAIHIIEHTLEHIFELPSRVRVNR